jgi:hypothetical protein
VADTEMDFQASVAPAYELLHRPRSDPLVQSVGKSRLIRPTRNAMDDAVRRLLGTSLPKLRPIEWRGKSPEADQIAALEQNVLAITRRTGLLNSELHPGTAYERERMSDWLFLAQAIQWMFSGRQHDGSVQSDELFVADLSVYVSFKSGRPDSMVVRPACTRDALMYCAAQMIASGTRPQQCKWCKGQFFIGGPRARGKKKEGSRFCQEQCRWDYNNARRKRG